MSLETLDDGRRARSRATRERILLTAERLFAESGIGNVSLRDIGIAAEQKNNGAVQYHFGDRDNLIVQIVIYRAAFIEEVREKLLSKVRQGKKPPKVSDYVRTFVISMASSLSEDNYFLRFLSRLVVERGGIPYRTIVASSAEAMRKVMGDLLPHLPAAVIHQRWQIVMANAVHMLASYRAAEAAGYLAAPFEQLMDDLIDFLTAGLSAPYRASEERRTLEQRSKSPKSRLSRRRLAADG